MLKHTGEIIKESVSDMKEYIIIKRSKQDDSKFVVMDRFYIRESGILIEKRFKGKLIGHGEEEYDIKQIQLINGNEYYVLDNAIRVKQFIKTVSNGDDYFEEFGMAIISLSCIKDTEVCAGYYKDQKCSFIKYTMNDGSVKYVLNTEGN